MFCVTPDKRSSAFVLGHHAERLPFQDLAYLLSVHSATSVIHSACEGRPFGLMPQPSGERASISHLMGLCILLSSAPNPSHVKRSRAQRPEPKKVGSRSLVQLRGDWKTSSGSSS